MHPITAKADGNCLFNAYSLAMVVMYGRARELNQTARLLPMIQRALPDMAEAQWQVLTQRRSSDIQVTLAPVLRQLTSQLILDDEIPQDTRGLLQQMVRARIHHHLHKNDPAYTGECDDDVFSFLSDRRLNRMLVQARMSLRVAQDMEMGQDVRINTIIAQHYLTEAGGLQPEIWQTFRSALSEHIQMARIFTGDVEFGVLHHYLRGDIDLGFLGNDFAVSCLSFEATETAALVLRHQGDYLHYNLEVSQTLMASLTTYTPQLRRSAAFQATSQEVALLRKHGFSQALGKDMEASQSEPGALLKDLKTSLENKYHFWLSNQSAKELQATQQKLSTGLFISRDLQLVSGHDGVAKPLKALLSGSSFASVRTTLTVKMSRVVKRGGKARIQAGSELYRILSKAALALLPAYKRQWDAYDAIKTMTKYHKPRAVGELSSKKLSDKHLAEIYWLLNLYQFLVSDVDEQVKHRVCVTEDIEDRLETALADKQSSLCVTRYHESLASYCLFNVKMRGIEFQKVRMTYTQPLDVEIYSVFKGELPRLDTLNHGLLFDFRASYRLIEEGFSVRLQHLRSQEPETRFVFEIQHKGLSKLSLETSARSLELVRRILRGEHYQLQLTDTLTNKQVAITGNFRDQVHTAFSRHVQKLGFIDRGALLECFYMHMSELRYIHLLRDVKADHPLAQYKTYFMQDAKVRLIPNQFDGLDTRRVSLSLIPSAREQYNSYDLAKLSPKAISTITKIMHRVGVDAQCYPREYFNHFALKPGVVVVQQHVDGSVELLHGKNQTIGHFKAHNPKKAAARYERLVRKHYAQAELAELVKLLWTMLRYRKGDGGEPAMVKCLKNAITDFINVTTLQFPDAFKDAELDVFYFIAGINMGRRLEAIHFHDPEQTQEDPLALLRAQQRHAKTKQKPPASRKRKAESVKGKEEAEQDDMMALFPERHQQAIQIVGRHEFMRLGQEVSGFVLRKEVNYVGVVGHFRNIHGRDIWVEAHARSYVRWETGYQSTSTERSEEEGRDVSGDEAAPSAFKRAKRAL